MALFESELHATLAFNRITLGSPKHATRLLHGFDCVLAFFERFDAGEANLPPRLSSQLSNPCSKEILRGIDKDLAWLQGEERSFISLFDEDYPFLLQQIDDPPVCLFCSGEISLLKRDQIAIVGSRKPTQLGLKIAGIFATELVEQGIAITSGLAHGIDGAAHSAAMEGGGQTIAVFGAGMDTIYPRNHERLAMRILQQGLLVSEFPIGCPPLARFFPQRNRIVTGLSLGTVIVEAAKKSGTMISARMAMEQNREVFAIPGSIYSAQSEGCHALIKLGAKLTQNVEDILEELPNYSELTGIVRPNNVSEEAMGILQYINTEAISVDDLFELTEIPIPSLLAQLLNLELEGYILNEVFGYVRTSR